MTKRVLIIAANGQIARIVEDRILTEANYSDVELTLFLRDAQRLSSLKDNSRVTIVEGSLDNYTEVLNTVKNQDIIFVAVVDHTRDHHQTKNVIRAMQETGVKRVIYTNVLGIYNEVPGEFGEWNASSIGKMGLQTARNSDQLLVDSGLEYTTLRLPWLNDKGIKYELTHRDETYNGVSGSRQSIADVVLKIIANPKLAVNDSLGIADPDTQGENRPVY